MLALLSVVLIAAPAGPVSARCRNLMVFKTRVCLSDSAPTAALERWGRMPLGELPEELRDEWRAAAASASEGNTSAVLEIWGSCGGNRFAQPACVSLLPLLLDAIPAPTRDERSVQHLRDLVREACERVLRAPSASGDAGLAERAARCVARASVPPEVAAATAVPARAAVAPVDARPVPAPPSAEDQAPRASLTVPQPLQWSFSVPLTLGAAFNRSLARGTAQNGWAFGVRPSAVAYLSRDFGAGGYAECLWSNPFVDLRCGAGGLVRLGLNSSLFAVSPSVGAYARREGSGVWEPGVAAGVWVGARHDDSAWEGPAGLRVELAVGLGASQAVTLLVGLEIDPLYLIVLPLRGLGYLSHMWEHMTAADRPSALLGAA